MKGRAARPARGSLGRAAGTLLPTAPKPTAPTPPRCHRHPPGESGLLAWLFRMEITFFACLLPPR